MAAADFSEAAAASASGKAVVLGPGASSSSLDNLIAALMEYHSLDDIQDKLERLPSRCRARMHLRSYFLTLSPNEEPDEASLREVLTTAVRYVFLSLPPSDAIYHLSSLGRAVELANVKAQRSLFNRHTADLREVAEYLVESYGLSTPGSDTLLYDPLMAIRQIQGFRVGELSSSVLEPFKAQGQVISAWGLVEHTLKLALGFYACHFSRPDWVRYFKDAIRNRSIGPIIQSLKVVETIFREGEPARERRDRKNDLCERLKPIQEELDETREKLRRRSVRLEDVQQELLQEDDKIRVEELKGEAEKLGEEIKHLQNHADFLEESIKQHKEAWQREEQEARKVAEQRARDLRAECLSHFGRETPFADLDLEQDFHQELGSLYRNEFAHHPGDQVVEKEKVSESLREAERIIVELVQKRIVPTFMRLVGQGTDVYGRRIFLFIEERWMTPEGEFDPDKLRWFYPSSELKYEPFQRLLMIEPETDETWKEPIIEPVIYTPEEIANAIYGRRAK